MEEAPALGWGITPWPNGLTFLLSIYLNWRMSNVSVLVASFFLAFANFLWVAEVQFFYVLVVVFSLLFSSTFSTTLSLIKIKCHWLDVFTDWTFWNNLWKLVVSGSSLVLGGKWKPYRSIRGILLGWLPYPFGLLLHCPFCLLFRFDTNFLRLIPLFKSGLLKDTFDATAKAIGEKETRRNREANSSNSFEFSY